MSAVFDKVGGDALRAVIADFYDRVFADMMIGFLFAGKDKQRLIDKEWELAAVMLGAPGVRYTGRPIRAAHAASPILVLTFTLDGSDAMTLVDVEARGRPGRR